MTGIGQLTRGAFRIKDLLWNPHFRVRAQGYTSSSSASTAWFYTIMNLGKVLPRKRKKTGADSGSYSAAYLRLRWRQAASRWLRSLLLLLLHSDTLYSFFLSSWWFFKWTWSHVKLVHDEKKPLKCKFCDNCFSHKGDINKHLASVHENKNLRYSLFILPGWLAIWM